MKKVTLLIVVAFFFITSMKAQDTTRLYQFSTEDLGGSVESVSPNGLFITGYGTTDGLDSSFTWDPYNGISRILDRNVKFIGISNNGVAFGLSKGSGFDGDPLTGVKYEGNSWTYFDTISGSYTDVRNVGSLASSDYYVGSTFIAGGEGAPDTIRAAIWTSNLSSYLPLASGTTKNIATGIMPNLIGNHTICGYSITENGNRPVIWTISWSGTNAYSVNINAGTLNLDSIQTWSGDLKKMNAGSVTYAVGNIQVDGKKDGLDKNITAAIRVRTSNRTVNYIYDKEDLDAKFYGVSIDNNGNILCYKEKETEITPYMWLSRDTLVELKDYLVDQNLPLEETFSLGILKDMSLDGKTFIGVTPENINWIAAIVTPEIVEYFPVQSAIMVKPDTEVRLKFNRKIYEAAENSLSNISIVGVENGVTATILDSSIVITHPLFENDSTYQVIIPAQTLKGQNSEIKWSFTTHPSLITSLYPRFYEFPASMMGAEGVKSISSNGKYVVGANSQYSGGSFLWNSGDPYTPVSITDPVMNPYFNSVSDDGTLAGTAKQTPQTTTINRAAIYTSGNGVEYLHLGVSGDLNDQYAYAVAYGINGDGNTVVGNVYRKTGTGDDATVSQYGAVWDPVNPSNPPSEYANDPYEITNRSYGTIIYSVSKDGNVKVGTIKKSSSEKVAVYWVGNGERQSIVPQISDFPGYDEIVSANLSAYSVSPNGKYATGIMSVTLKKDGVESSINAIYAYNIEDNTIKYKADIPFVFGMLASGHRWLEINEAPISVTNEGNVFANCVWSWEDYSSQYQGVYLDMQNNESIFIEDYLKERGIPLTMDKKLGYFKGVSEDLKTMIGYGSQSWIAMIDTIGRYSPYNGETEVKVSTIDIYVNFNAPMTASDLTNISITPSLGLLNSEISADGMKLSIVPTNTPAYKTEYTVLIPANSIEGVAEDLTWTFTTETDPKYIPIVELKLRDYPSDDPYTHDFGAQPCGVTDTLYYVMTNIGGDSSIVKLKEVRFKAQSNPYFEPFSSDMVLATNKAKMSEKAQNMALKKGENIEFFIAYNAWDTRDFYYGNLRMTVDNVYLDTVSPYVKLTSVAPELDHYIPQNNAERIDIDATVQAVFKSRINSYGGGVSIKDPDNNSVASVNQMIDSNVMRISHAKLQYGKEYTVTINGSTVRGITSAISWKFTTISQADGATPAPGVEDVQGSQAASWNAGDVKVGEEMDSEDLLFALKNVGGNRDGIFLSVSAVEIKESVEGTWNLEFAGEGYPSGISYPNDMADFTIKFTPKAAGEFTDTAVVKTNGGDLRFVLKGTGLLLVNELTPLDASTEVDLDAEVSVTFSNDITAYDENSLSAITISYEDEGTPVMLEDVEGEITDNKLTVTHPELERGVTYTVTIPENTVKYQAESISWTFTSRIVLVAETYEPALDTEEVIVTTGISVEFNKNIEAFSETSLTGVTLNDLENISAAIDGNTLKINYEGTLEYETEYTVNIPANTLKDQLYVITWTFTTEVEPAIIAETFIPEAGAENVELNTEVSVTFDKDITAISEEALSEITISGMEGVNGSIIGNRLTITHEGELVVDTEYTVTIPANTLKNQPNEITWKFTTKQVEGIRNAEKLSVEIYPNPSSGLVNVVVENNSTLKVVDATGRIIKTNTLKANTKTTVDLSDRAKGIYIFHIESEGRISVKNVIKQ